ncbi:hypothetical protein EJB05_19777, partial [Eragrostis curvula]
TFVDPNHRFHQLSGFDQGKRSCRAGASLVTMSAGGGHHLDLSPRAMAGLLHPANMLFLEPGRFRSFLLDFSYPRVSSTASDAWPTIQPAGTRMSSTIQWQGNHELHPHRSAVAGYGDHAYVHWPGWLGAFELPPGGCVAGVATDCSCALSLLSTQPWDTTQSASHHRSPAMSTASAFEGTPVSPSVMASSYKAASTWTGSRVHEGARNLQHHSPHEDGLHVVHPVGSVHHGHFSVELELALGSGPSNQPQVDHGTRGGGDGVLQRKDQGDGAGGRLDRLVRRRVAARLRTRKALV